MKIKLLILGIVQFLLLFTCLEVYSQDPVKSMPHSRNSFPPGPCCMIVFDKGSGHMIDCEKIEELIRPKTIKSLKVVTGKSRFDTAIYGTRAASGMTIVTIKKRYSKSEMNRLKPYLLN